MRPGPAKKINGQKWLLFWKKLYFFGKNWISGDVAFRYNTVLEGFQNNAFLEFGRKITPDNLIYIHPSAAFGGKKSYNYGIEAGILILF